jgi:hypothetical protein
MIFRCNISQFRARHRLSLPHLARRVLGLGPATRNGHSAGQDLTACCTEIAPFIRSGQSLRVDELGPRGR